MKSSRLDLDTLAEAFIKGWEIANATRRVSIAYAGIFTVIGALILGGLIASGRTPFIIPAAGAFMLVAPATLAGFFAVARKVDAGETADFRTLMSGFPAASHSLWGLALACGMLSMIFITDVAILYSYMVGSSEIFIGNFVALPDRVGNFVFWGMISGAVVALLLFAVSVFSVPLLCERRATLVEAVVTSVSLTLKHFLVLMLWAGVLAFVIIGSVLLLPLLPMTLPWLAYASYALYRAVLPPEVVSSEG
jgi:uncharacterized membrane protein